MAAIRVVTEAAEVASVLDLCLVIDVSGTILASQAIFLPRGFMVTDGRLESDGNGIQDF
jgi:hypothetical protein